MNAFKKAYAPKLMGTPPGTKFGVSPSALKAQNAQLAASKVSPAAHAPHVAGVPIPGSIAQHVSGSMVVPSEHPAREVAAKFVSDVWRKDKNQGRLLSEKLLGIGEGGKRVSKSEINKMFRSLKKDEAPKPPEAPKYNPKLERPNQRQRVADVKERLLANAPEGGHKVSLSTTNSKLAKDGVASFNLVPIETCPGAGSCAKYCYADTGSYLRFHKTTMPPRVSNWLASQKEDFVPKMISMIGKEKAKGKIKAIRVHDSGDFYSPQYVDKWHSIASAHPDMMFYAYTKSHHPKLRERLNELEKLPNFNVVQSFGSKYDQLIDPSKPHAVVFPDEATMKKAGYADAMATDLTAADKNNKKVGLYIHGQYDKSYPGLEEHLKDNPQIHREVMEAIGANGGQVQKKTGT